MTKQDGCTLKIEEIKEHKIRYPKKDLITLLNALEVKGVKFSIVTKENAKKNLENLNYYYKLTVYKRNFNKSSEGKYLNLEFSYLGDIASVDMQLRYILAQFCLDIEHSLKTLLMKEVTENNNLDGYDIIEQFIQSTEKSHSPISKNSLLKKASHISNYQYALYNTHKDCPPVWAVLEIMSFGEFTRLLEFYLNRYPKKGLSVSSLRGLLAGVKRVRNMSMHSTPFLFDLSSNPLEHVNNCLVGYCFKLNIKKPYYKMKKIHDVICVLYMHDEFVKGQGSRVNRCEDLSSLVDRSTLRFHYLNQGSEIMKFFSTLRLILDNYDNKL